MTDIKSVKSVSVYLACKQGSFDSLNADEKDFLAYIVAAAYAKTHGDDELMFNWKEAVLANSGGMGWTADFVGDNKTKINLRGKDNKTWADYVVDGAKNSPFPALKDLDKCKISALFSEKASNNLAVETLEEA